MSKLSMAIASRLHFRLLFYFHTIEQGILRVRILFVSELAGGPMRFDLTQGKALRLLIVPQAIRLILPPLTNDFISLLKDSSLVSALMMVELTGAYPKASTILAPACWWRFCIYFLFFRSCGLPPRWRSGSARDD